MWEGFINAINDYIERHELTADLVIDRFHVATNYRDGFDELRKKEVRRLKKELPEETYKADCHGALWLLRRNYDNLDDKQREQLRRLLAHSPQLHLAYSLRQELTAIFEMNLSRKQGRNRLLKWVEKVEGSGLDCFDKFIKTLRGHLEWIANYFVRRASSGFVEGLNNKIKVIKRRCYGIKKIGTLFQRLWLDLKGYALFA
jgi:transposase